MTSPARVYATINRTNVVSNKLPQKHTLEDAYDYEKGMKDKVYQSAKKMPSSENEIRVCACGELSLAPDRCKVFINVSSKKEKVDDAKNSVSRRVDYILQTLHNHHLKDEDIASEKVLRRTEGLIYYGVELSATFIDFTRCQTVCNFLAEKLDDIVKISLPDFFHSPQRLENLRRQASVLAVNNAKQKATEIAKYLQGSTGKAIAIHEEDSTEWEGQGHSDTPSYDTNIGGSVQSRMSQATVNVRVKVIATFELMHKPRNVRI